jgi:preprotein translocase subunit SecD
VRRFARTLAFVLILVVAAGLALGFQEISIRGFERGGDTLLGLTLGLDLQGGSHLIYKADQKDADGESITPTAEEMQSLLRTIERRVNSAGLGEPILQLLGDDRLLIQLPGVKDTGRAKTLIGETARLEFKHRQLNVSREVSGLTGNAVLNVQVGTMTASGDLDAIPVFTPGTTTPVTATSTEAVGAATSTDEGSATSTDIGDPPPAPAILLTFEDDAATALDGFADRMEASLIPVEGATQIFPIFLTIGVPGASTRLMRVPYLPMIPLPDGSILPIPGQPLVVRVGNTNQFMINLSGEYISIEEAVAVIGTSPTLVFGEEAGAIDEDFGLTGDDLARAYPSQLPQSGFPVVNLEFNADGTNKFADLTSQIAGSRDQIAIILDGVELIAPVVNQPITSGTAFIQGAGFTFERVQDIALLLEGGRLPLPITLIQERDVDAILGADSLRKSTIAGAIGLALVLIFMVAYYRAPGLVAALALTMYAILLLAVFKLLPVTLTLSGIAAAILSVGMAVDANILIFERMKEELRAGRTLLSSINIGFNRAWPAIRDGNVSTLITCAILFWFADTLGASIVQGFAATLAMGVGISMFSAITISRTLIRITAVSPLGKRLGLFIPSGGRDLPQQEYPASAGA